MADMKKALANWDAADEALQEQIDKCVKEDGWTIIKKIFTQTAANTLEDTGVRINVPLGKVAMITVMNKYSNSVPVEVAIVRSTATDATSATGWERFASGTMECSLIHSPVSSADCELAIWTSHKAANANDLIVKYKFI